MIVFRRLLWTSESNTELYIIGYIIIFHWLKSYVRACPHYWADEDLRESDKAFLTGVSLEITKSVPLTVNLSYFIFTGENNVNYLYFTISDPSSAVLSTCRNLLIFTLNPAWNWIVIRLLGYLVIRLFSYSVIRLFGYSVIRLFGYSVIRLFSYSVIRLFGYSVIRLFGYSVIRLFGYSVIWLFGYSVIRLFGCSVI